jgi:hypothetical protein
MLRRPLADGALQIVRRGADKEDIDAIYERTAIYTDVCGPEDAAPAARILVLKTGYDNHEDDAAHWNALLER